MHLKFINDCDEDNVLSSLLPIDSHLKDQPLYQCTCVNFLLPSDSMHRHRFIDTLTAHGLSFPTVLLTYTAGGNIGNIYFMWQVSPDADFSTCLDLSQSAVECAKKDIPVFHTRAMRSAVFTKFGRVSPAVKPAVLRHFYKDLTGKLLFVVVINTQLCALYNIKLI